MSVTESLRRLRLFVLSYAPLTTMLAIRAFPSHVGELWTPLERPWFWIWTIASALGYVEAYRLPRSAGRLTAVDVRLTDVTDEGGAVAGYIATYLYPLLSTSPSGWREVAVAAVYGLLLLVVFVRSDLGLVNPTLYLLGWRTASATRSTANGERRVFLLYPSELRLSRTLEVRAAPLGDFLVLQRQRGAKP